MTHRRFERHVYEVRPRKDKRGADLIWNVLPFGRLWYGEPNAVANAIGYAQHRSRSHAAVIHVYADAGDVIDRTLEVLVQAAARAASTSGKIEKV